MIFTVYDAAGAGINLSQGSGLLGPGSEQIDLVPNGTRFLGYEGSGQLWAYFYYVRSSPTTEATGVLYWDGYNWFPRKLELYRNGSIIFILDEISDFNFASGPQAVLSDSDEIYGNRYRDVINGFAGNDWLRGWGGNDYINGGVGNDSIIGDTGTDVLHGGSGNDVLYGGAGKDQITGGYGGDSFAFETIRESGLSPTTADIILDFNRQYDWIALDLIDASVVRSGNNQFVFRGTSRFTTSADGEVRYQKFNNSGTANDYTMVFIDNDRDTQAEMAIRIRGLHSLTVDDFWL